MPDTPENPIPPPDCSNVSPEASHRAGDDVLPLIYDELRAIAAHWLRRRPGLNTLQPTVVVHEAWLRLVARKSIDTGQKTHFLALAAQAMRWVVSDHARRARADKRGGDWKRITLSAADKAKSTEIDLVALDEALNILAERDPRAAQVIQMRFFGGLTLEETAEALSVSVGTVKNEWRWARAWLLEAMSDSAGDSTPSQEVGDSSDGDADE
jgi:RNA polymerase sigma-70 factor, ECF subfamily